MSGRRLPDDGVAFRFGALHVKVHAEAAANAKGAAAMHKGISARLSIFAAAALLLGACDTANTVRGVDGAAVGVVAEWKPVAANEANFSILGDWALVTGPWSNRDIQTRKQTQVRIADGYIMYESNIGARTEAPAAKNLEIVYKNDLNIQERLGLPLAAGNPRTLRLQAGRVDYALWRGQTHMCFGAMVFSDAHRLGYDNGEVYLVYARGARCIAAADPRAANFEDVSLDLFKRIVLDQGIANRARLPGA